MASFEDFLKIEMRIGTVTAAERHDRARDPAYVLTIDFGPGTGTGTRTSSAQITERYAADALIGRQVVAVTNLSPKRIAGILSEVLVLGISDADGAVVLLAPEKKVENGVRVF